MFLLIVVITEKVYFSAHSPSVSGAWKARCKAWCFLCVGWRCDDNLLQDLRQRVTKLWRRSWKHSYCKLLRLFVMCTFNHGSTHFMLIWRSGGLITLYITLFCWECTSLGKIYRALLKLRRMLLEIKLSLGFENLFCSQICLDSFILKVTVRLYLFCFGLKITICLVWRMCDASTRKKKNKLRAFFNLRSINFRLTKFW